MTPTTKTLDTFAIAVGDRIEADGVTYEMRELDGLFIWHP